MKGIEVLDVSKKFKNVEALNRVSVKFEEHKIYGLLGRNGAGKSTLLNIISDRIFADSGQVRMDGEVLTDNSRLLCQVYLMSEQDLYPEGMKVKEAFRWSKEFYPDFDMDYALSMSKLFGLNLKSSVKNLSTGYKSIFKNIIALSVNVPYVFLDEPVLGLDANHRELFYKVLVEKYAENPFTAVISTHLIEEVSGVIEEVIMIKNGEVIRNEPREVLLSGGYTVSGKASEVEQFAAGRDVIGIDSIGGLKTAYILGKLDRNEVPESLEIGHMDLQKIFIQLTNS